MEIAVIGGGAAGFFSAITVKENYPDAKVVISYGFNAQIKDSKLVWMPAKHEK